MAQIFPKGATSVARAILVVIVAAPLAFLGFQYAIARSGNVTGQGKYVEQPVPFSHQHHAGELGIDCRMCHVSVETSAYAGMPTTHVCMSCHSQIWTEAPMLAPVRRSLATGRPLHWKRVYKLPGYVYFNHSVHVAKGVSCAQCHGEVREMPLMRQATPMTMQWCLSCHRDPEPYLGPTSQVIAADHPPMQAMDEKTARAHAYMRRYHVRPAGLDDCSVCHR